MDVQGVIGLVPDIRHRRGYPPGHLVICHHRSALHRGRAERHELGTICHHRCSAAAWRSSKGGPFIEGGHELRSCICSRADEAQLTTIERSALAALAGRAAQ